MPLNFERRKTSKDRLKLKWDFPASIELKVDKSGRTTAQVRMYALGVDEAFKRIAGDDKRPLLIVRECGKCKGSDDAVLSRTLDNEKTLVLTRWFHCVKLMHHVLEKDHTFAKLFSGDRPPHLFLSSPDGSNLVPLSGGQSQGELWESMRSLIKVHYKKDADKAIKEIMKVFTTYDHLDSMEDMVLEQVDAELEKKGPKSRRLKKLKAKLSDIAAKKKAAEAREKKVSDLELIKKIEPAKKAG